MKKTLLFLLIQLPIFLLAQNKEIKLIENAEQGFVKRNIGNTVNSVVGELMPVISADGKTLYFARDKHPDNISKNHTDIWYAEKNTDTTWKAAVNIAKPLNNNGGNSIISVTPDGNKLLIMGQYAKNGDYKGPGISMTTRTKDGWETPKNIEIENHYNRNSYAGYCLAPDGKTILMYVERDDSFGDLDLYVSFMKDDKKWTAPKNCGVMINTNKTEATPFIAADNTTVYFASDGRPGYGSYDIFMTRRLNDNWTEWTEPLNLGSDINGPGFDAYYTVPASGDFAYFVSSEKSYGATDILKIEIPESARPKPVVLVEGQVFNQVTKKPMAANITYSDLKTNKKLGIATASVADGSFKIALPSGREYSFLAEKAGFYSVSENLDLTKLTKFEIVKRDLFIAPIKKGTTIRLNNLFFASGKFALKTSSYPELNRLANIMKNNEQMIIEVGGHTDDVGSNALNQKLSKNRADAVVNYLLTQNIARNRIKSKGYGEAKPVVKNDSEANRSKNRRVEFTIITK